MADAVNDPVTDDDAAQDNPLRNESRRLETFLKWPKNAKVEAGKIAKAGFYYTGNYLEVRCIWCNLILSTWEYGDQVMGRHRRSRPDCPFVLNTSNNVPLATSPQPTSSQLSHQTMPSPSSQISGEQDSLIAESVAADESQPLALEIPQDLPQSSPNLTFDSMSRDESHPDFRVHFSSEENRLRTFQNWPIDFIRAEDCAKAGFIFSGIEDRVRCVFCLGYVGSWEEADRPDTAHAELFPDCPFVQNIDCGNVPMSPERQQEVLLELQARRDTQGNVPRASRDMTSADAVGVDEVGIRVTDMHSGPGVLTIKDPSSGNNTEEMIGVIKHSGPAHSKYATIESRLRTFRDWPPALKQQPQDLAEAGFYYIGLSDQVKCFYCDGGLRNWQPEDDPWVEHARWFSKCSFVRLVKGDQYIAQCIQNKPPDDMAELPMTNSEQYKLSEENLQAMMDSIEVQEALSSGIDPSRIRKAFQKKWRETGTGFSGSQNLIDALYSVQFEPEGNFSTAATNCPSAPSANSSSTSPSQSSQVKSNSAPTGAEASSTVATLAVPGTSTMADPVTTKLPSPSFPDKGLGLDEPAPKTSDLEDENRRLKEERTCKICMDKEIGVVFLPCGHLICCNQCAPALANCPLCRQPIHGTVKTYMS